MVITLYGPDSYRRIRRLNELVSASVEKRGTIAHERFNLETQENFDRFRNFVNTPSMFSSKKLVILENPFEYSKTKELKEVLKSNTGEEDINIIITTEKKFSSPFKFLEEKPNVFEEFNKLEGPDLDGFVKNEAKRLGIELGKEDVQTIKDSLGADTWRIYTQLEQVALMADKNIKIRERKVDYFPVFNALKYGKRSEERLVALERLLSGDRSDVERLFNGLAFRLRDESEAEMYADYNAAARAGRLDYEEVLVAIALGLKFNPLDW